MPSLERSREYQLWLFRSFTRVLIFSELSLDQMAHAKMWLPAACGRWPRHSSVFSLSTHVLACAYR
jgi:hypothetical protein